MSAYINGTGAVSAQPTFGDNPVAAAFHNPAGNRWLALEPDYAALIDARQIRRMSRVIRMGIVAAQRSMREAGIEMPGAVVVGTSLGCLGDTESFLTKMVEHREEMLSPTAFIHSTHNTIASQIALLYGCRGYNSTYVHRSLSFESALIDALLLLEEGTAHSVLAGGIDETTDTSFTIMERLGHFKKEEDLRAASFYGGTGSGSVAGEGSVFFTLSANPSPGSYARLTAVETCSFSGTEIATQVARRMLEQHDIETPFLLVSGMNGDPSTDKRHHDFARALDQADRFFRYKHWSGEYATSTAFGVWMAAQILRNGSIPGAWKQSGNPDDPVRSVLIHNNSVEAHHSLILLTAC
jgi:hypothetical protein